MRNYIGSLFLSLGVILVLFKLSFAQTDSLVITSYYPSPMGVYSEVRLVPKPAPSAVCNAATEGLMFYSSASQQLGVCTNFGAGGWDWGVRVNRLVVDGKVGVGTASPQYMLDVRGGALNPGIYGETFNIGLAGVVGNNGNVVGGNGVVGTSVMGNGVFGTTSGNTANGVYGESLGGSNGVAGKSAWGHGVYGESQGSDAVLGNNFGTTVGNHNGVSGYSINGFGVWGGGTGSAAIFGDAWGADKTGVHGKALVGNGWGVFCEAANCGGTGIGGWQNTSDARLKTNIITIENALDKVKKLRGVNFEWKSGPAKGRKDMGFIAQEAKEVVPELVNKNAADGYYMMATSQITAVLVEAMKEQQKQIESLKKEINALKSNNPS